MGVLITPIGTAFELVVPRVVRIGLASLSTIVFVAIELIGRGSSLPQNRRLVPQEVMAKGEVLGPLQFGFELGLGTRTYITSSLPLAALTLVLFVGGGLLPPLLCSLGFGIGRAVLIPLRAPDPELWDARLLANRRSFKLLLLASFAIAATSVLMSPDDL